MPMSEDERRRLSELEAELAEQRRLVGLSHWRQYDFEVEKDRLGAVLDDIQPLSATG